MTIHLLPHLKTHPNPAQQAAIDSAKSWLKDKGKYILDNAPVKWGHGNNHTRKGEGRSG